MRRHLRSPLAAVAACAAAPPPAGPYSHSQLYGQSSTAGSSPPLPGLRLLGTIQSEANG
eukprot:gene49279-6576_t